jgi:hypothetical protein
MRLRRQILASILLAVALVAPFRVPAGTPSGRAEAYAGQPAQAAITEVFLPVFTRSPSQDVSVSRVEVIQGVTLADNRTVHIAGRPALVRVFVALSGGSSLPGVGARLRRFVGAVEQDSLSLGPQTVVAVPNEGNLSHTFNFSLPASWLVAGSSYVVDLDPANSLPESSEANNRYPASGTQPFSFVTMAPLEVVIVPVTYKGHTPPLGDLSYVTWMPTKLLPMSQINYSVHAPHPFTGDLADTNGSGWQLLLSQIEAIHYDEDRGRTRLYYGLVDSVAADGCSGGCISGIGYTTPGIQTSAGFAGFPSSTQSRQEASPTFTHEMGHNFGRQHAPCGNPGGPDSNYPYVNAVIGQWGYDTASGQLKNPTTYFDYMSYCGNQYSNWTSDYTYFGIAQAWSSLPAATIVAGGAALGEALVVSGRFTPDGTVEVDPVFRTQADRPMSVTPASYRLNLLDAQRGVLASLPFEPAAIVIDAPVGSITVASFQVLAEPVPGLAGLRVYHGASLLYERLAEGAAPVLALTPLSQRLVPAGGVAVGWQLLAGPAGMRYRVRFSPDGGESWYLLAVESAIPQIDVPAQLLAKAKAPLLEIQASDGVRTDVRTFALEGVTSGSSP